MTRQLILGTAGHIDHGKTALVAALTGVDTDRLPEEKARGITIDIGFANLTLPNCNIGIVDVPGHERFVRNMLAGAAGIDLALLVVAADDSVMPQTREHLSILQLLGIKHGLIALTKCDLPESTWIDLVEEEIRDVVNHTFLENAPIVRTSARAGVGIDELKRVIEEVGDEVDDNDNDWPFRLAVDRAFVKEGLGTIVTGTVWSGIATIGDELDWLPVNKKVRIRGLQSHGKPTEIITSGQRAAIQLAGVHHAEIHRGHELAYPGYLKPSKIVTVNLQTLAGSPLPIKHRARLRLYLGSGEVTAVVSLLRANTLEPGEKMEAQLFCADPVSAVNGQAFVIRSESPIYTLGGGIILNSNATPLKRKHADSINRLHHLTSPDPKVRVKESLYFQGLNQLNHLDIARIAAVKPTEVSSLVQPLIKDGDLIQLQTSSQNTTPIHREIIRTITGRIITQITRLHKQHPLQSFIPIQRLTRHFDYIEPLIFNALLTHLCETNQLKQNESGIALKEFTPILSPNQKQLLENIPTMIGEGGFTPPDSAQLAATLNTTESELQPILDLCIASGELIHIAGGMFLHRERHETMIRIIHDNMIARGELSVSKIRELLSTSRKFAIPICEHLDRINFTKRRGNVRIPGSNFNRNIPQPADIH